MRSRSLLWSFNYAIAGIVYAVRTQRNMRVHVTIAGGVLLAGLLLNVSHVEMLALLFAVALVLSVELMNTAIEATVDLVVERFDPMAKVAKDVAAGAVFIAAIGAVGIGYVVFYDPLTALATDGYDYVRQAPLHLTVIALGLTVIVVLALKALNSEDTWLEGGWPSGHVAVSCAAATAIGYATGSASAFLLGLLIAGLVAQSRVESETHSIAQVLGGAVVGLLISTLVFQVFLA